MSDTFINLTFCLCNRLSHFLSHETSVFRFVFREDLLEVAKLFKAALYTRMSLCILVAKAVIRAIDYTFKLFGANSLERPMQLIVFRI